MTTPRPASAELLNHGVPTTPRQSACVILLRDGEAGPEVLLVQRNPAQRFMGGYWVFPGGAVDAAEGAGDGAHRAAAVRELREEAGVGGVDPAQLVKYSRWITPELIKMRFDTHFFLAPAPAGAQPAADGVECVGARWIAPAAALQAYGRDELPLVFPTIRHLEELSAFPSVAALIADARAKIVQPVMPRVLLVGDDAQVVLPGEPGYDAG
jgi:8-oxo-dGTP pyrophosphatase MutT (NUDIX family)